MNLQEAELQLHTNNMIIKNYQDEIKEIQKQKKVVKLTVETSDGDESYYYPEDYDIKVALPQYVKNAVIKTYRANIAKIRASNVEFADAICTHVHNVASGKKQSKTSITQKRSK